MSSGESEIGCQSSTTALNHSNCPTIEFANIKSAEIFNIDIDDLGSKACLERRRFMPLDKSAGELYENTAPDETWRMNALRVRIETYRDTFEKETQQELLSLKDILEKKESHSNAKNPEAYVVLDENVDDKEDHESNFHD